jgi:hypothetical protein
MLSNKILSLLGCSEAVSNKIARDSSLRLLDTFSIKVIMDLAKFKEALRVEAELLSRGEAFEKGICARCQKPPQFYSEAGRREYRISGLCEYCFDAVTMEPEDIEVKMNDPNETAELTEKELEDAMMEEDLEPENDDDEDEDTEDDNDDSA